MERYATEDIKLISHLYSHLGYRVLSGDVDAVKWFYASAWQESPPLIRTIRALQMCLTEKEIELDELGIFGKEFLYYWGMINLGEVSNLIIKNTGTAQICFEKTHEEFPQVQARMAFIKLLNSTEPAESEDNVIMIDAIRQWAGKHDLFSMIIIAKIVFYGFLNEDRLDGDKLPIILYQLLELPCQKGHPVAIRFWNEILDCINPSEAMDRVSKVKIDGNVLYDLYV